MLRFADCTIDVAARSLLRAGVLQHLEPQAFDVLVHLLENRHRVVAREELLDSVWGGRWISDSALATRMKELRRATGDTGDAQAIIRTVRGRGFQLVAEVTDLADSRVSESAPVLLGRDRDLAEVASRLAPGKLVTVVGPGGVGKTTLGRAISDRIATASAHGVAIVDLSALDSSADLLGAIRKAAGLVAENAENLIAALKRLDALLVLDDADDMVASVAQLCDRLAGGRLAVLVTCRERLGTRGEQLWPLLPLSTGAARQMLRDRAGSIAPLSGLAELPSNEIDALTAAVDRLPLALEMLASMGALLDLRELAAIVGSQPELITSAHRDAPERHRSLAALVATSLDRLDEQTLEVLLALSTFAGSFTASDAAGLVGGSTALGLVRELFDRSLISPVRSPDGPRFQMLRVVRTAATAGLSAPQRGVLARRHAQFVVEALEAADRDLRGPDEGRAVVVFNRLGDEARAAHAWARGEDSSIAVRLTTSLHLFAYSRLWAEPATWARALLVDGAGPPAAVLAVAAQAVHDGRLEEGRAGAEVALAAADSTTRTRALEVLSDLELYAGRTDESVAYSRELIASGLAVGDPRAVVLGGVNEVLAVLYAGSPREAHQLLASALRVELSQLAPSERAWLAFAKSEVLSATSDAEGAGIAAAEAIRVGEQVGNLLVTGVARLVASRLDTATSPHQAAAVQVELLESFRRQGDVIHLTSVLRAVVPLLAVLDEPAAAATLAGWALVPRARRRQGEDIEAVRRAQEALLSQMGPEPARAGARLTTFEAADVAFAALRRHI